MYRTLLTFSKRLLEPRAITGISEVRTLAPTTIYDIRRENHVRKCPNLPLTNRLYPQLLKTDNKLFGPKQDIRWSTEKGFQGSQIIYNLINMVKCVDLNELKDAPPAAFWTATAISASQLGIPFLEMIGGYCPFMTILQLNAAAITLGFFGGMKWGLAVSNDPEQTPTWDAMRWGLLPPALAITGLLLPYPLGFVAVGSGMMTSLYLDLKACVYPPWACAAAVVISVSTVIGLLFAMLGYVLFHNRLMNSKKGNGQDKEPEEDPTNGEEHSGNNAGTKNNKAS